MQTRLLPRRRSRPLLLAVLAVLATTACGTFANVGEDADDCELKPVATRSTDWSFGIQKVAALCASMVEVDGRTYSVGGGGWLDDESLMLEEYGVVTRANDEIGDPTVYALEGIDPLRLLLLREHRSFEGDPEASAQMGAYRVLLGEPGQRLEMPEGMCRYADPNAPGYPSNICALRTGRTYSVEMIIACGLETPVGPYGGDYWMVVDPPSPAADGSYPGMYHDGLDYGDLELLDADRAVYRGEVGAVLELRRLPKGSVTEIPPCERPN